MSFLKLLLLILQNVRRNRKSLFFSSVGITVGVAVFSFFAALTMGVRERVLDRIYPVDLIEVEPSSVSIAGARSAVERIPFDETNLGRFEALPGVSRVYPKLKSRFQATYRMGGQLFGQDGVTFEAWFDGLEEQVLQEELRQEETRANGGSDADSLRAKFGRQRRCADALDCSPEETCSPGGLCQPLEYWRLFADHGEYLPCKETSQCAQGYACLEGACRKLGNGGLPELPACAGGCPLGTACVPETCGGPADCLGSSCTDGRCALAGRCEFLPCTQTHNEAAVAGNPDLRRGVLSGRCADGRPLADAPSCEPARCPAGTYCSVIDYKVPGNFWYDKRGEGRCEQPIPVVLNPLVMELFNLVLDSTLQKAQLGTLKTLLGFEGEALYGHSFYRDVQRGVQPRQKLLKVVGFSRKALEAGVTMPMEYVRRANAAFAGGQGANAAFDSIILKIGRRERLPDTLESLDQNSIQLARRSAEAEKLRTILVTAMALFLIMSGLILGIAAVNIMHTFLMVIIERNREIGVLRSIGASRAQGRALFLGESVFVGVLGGVLGNLLAVASAWGVDRAAAAYLGRFPMKPDSFFLFEPRWLAAAVGAAVFFSLLGAFFPANRAAGMDPAKILSQP